MLQSYQLAMKPTHGLDLECRPKMIQAEVKKFDQTQKTGALSYDESGSPSVPIINHRPKMLGLD
jgi:hypothetical protein